MTDSPGDTVFPSAGDELVVKPAGLLIAGVAFVLTRGLLIDVVYSGSEQSPLVTATRLLPLILGLGVVVFGVSLAVSTKSRETVRTIATWYLLGSVWMLFLVGVGVFEATDPLGELRRSGVVATAVVGGGIGGLLMGIRSASENRQRRSLHRQAEQSVLLNRLLRHEVLNALTAIRGHAGLLADGRDEEGSFDAVTRNVDRIEQTVDDVGFIVRTADETRDSLRVVDLSEILERCRDRLPEGDRRVVFDGIRPVSVRADGYLDTVVANLVTTALERTADGNVTVTLDVEETMVGLTVTAPGSWLSERELDVLSNGLPRYDSPDVQFEVSITRLLVAEYGGSVVGTEGLSETVVTVELPRVEGRGDDRPAHSPGLGAVALRNAAVAGVVAGGVMGAVLQAFSGQIGIIGGLYGVQTLTVGWTTHLFHSVVFSMLFVGVWTRYRPDASVRQLPGLTALGIGYAVTLWLVAAGIVMGVWLNAVGIGASVPNLGVVSLAGHVAWGGTLAVVYRALPGADSSASGAVSSEPPASTSES